MIVKVLRFEPGVDEKPHLESYDIPSKEKMKVLDALQLINKMYNANIAFRSSCRAGQCGSCAVKMNGEVVLACRAEVEDGAVIEPVDLPVIKDLMVDRSEIEDKVRAMGLYLQSETRGIQRIKPEDYQDTKKLRGCIECFSCISSCPVIKESTEYAGPYFMRYISKFAFDPRDEAKRAAGAVKEGLYCCTTCGKCAEVCPKELNVPGDAIEKLRAMACREGAGPLDAHRKIKKLISETGRSVDRIKDGFIESVARKPDSRIGFFTGCLVDYRMPEVGMALLRVLREHGFEVDVPDGQVCCGSPMIRTGQLDIVEDLVEKNRRALEGYDTIITVCAGCGATLKKDYPRYGVELNVFDISEFLADRIDDIKMKPVNMRVTYHDPCHLLRGQGVKLEPRKILNSIPGLEFVEMEKQGQCCGSGGGVKSGKPEIAESLGRKKAEMIRKLNVDAVITICPFCQLHIKDSLEKEGLGDVKVMNILELLDMAYSDD
ncbi:fumarate reductase (CoM/CoB) subunit TfrB [Methanothermobacter sp.]|uniref:fumarate reductase (CoM/CoB) subunit TfrB n=1 Tax=Methanothermobacter sp. TaxID=1884223 RepID=UPI002603CFD0|nr:fumarate reductase (CoM/CoB) subunit TfrB [Methanothermobacter sp.]MDI9618971.1 succinate dehydrogenase/fumarate reductase iron-sulfur subunit [Methanothermobacter sp.]